MPASRNSTFTLITAGPPGTAENELPYGNIVALNENGAVLHHQHLEHEVPAAETFVSH